jgi:hypothetical protein
MLPGSLDKIRHSEAKEKRRGPSVCGDAIEILAAAEEQFIANDGGGGVEAVVQRIAGEHL